MRLNILENTEQSLTSQPQFLESLLLTWKRNPVLQMGPLGYPDRLDITLEPYELDIWDEVLATSVVRPPSSHIKGLEYSVEVSNRLHPEQSLSVEQLFEKEICYKIGNRVASRFRARQAKKLNYFYNWNFSVSCNSYDVKVLEGICRKASLEHLIVEDEFIVCNSQRQYCVYDALLLLKISKRQASEQSIFNLWQKSVVLGVQDLFIGYLERSQSVLLARHFQQILMEDQPFLGWRDDYLLTNFANGASVAKIEEFLRSDEVDDFSRQPHDRLESLLQTTRILGACHKELIEHYHEVLAVNYIKLGLDGISIGDFLAKLPVGFSLLAALNAVKEWRPEVIGAMIRSQEISEALYCILGLSKKRYVNGALYADLDQEWSAVQRTARDLVINSATDVNTSIILTLAVKDEIEGRNSSADFAESSWQLRFTDEGKSADLVASLKERFEVAQPIMTVEIVFAMRILALIASKQSPLSETLVRMIVGAYARSMNNKSGVRSSLHHLSSYRELLGQLWTALEKSPGLRQVWINPFGNVADFLGWSEEPVPTVISHKLVVPAFEVPRRLLVHSGNLLTQLSAASDIDGGDSKLELLNTVVELFRIDSEKAQRSAFEWPLITERSFWLHSERPWPVLAALGNSLTRHKAKDQLDTILACDPDVLQLSHLLWGIGDRDPDFRRCVKNRLDVKFATFILGDGCALGYASDLSSALYECGEFEFCIESSNLVLKIIEKFPDHHLYQYKEQVQVLRTASEIQLGQFEHALNISDEQQEQYLSIDALAQLQNLKAVALLNLKRHAEARFELDKILRHHPANEMALSNYVASYAMTREWHGVIEWASKARAKIVGRLPDLILQHEVIANLSIGNHTQAAALLDQLPEKLRKPLQEQFLTAVKSLS